jgi:hypothetical protein
MSFWAGVGSEYGKKDTETGVKRDEEQSFY